jgi:hypothetical protein
MEENALENVLLLEEESGKLERDMIARSFPIDDWVEKPTPSIPIAIRSSGQNFHHHYRGAGRTSSLIGSYIGSAISSSLSPLGSFSPLESLKTLGTSVVKKVGEAVERGFSL